MSALVIEHLLPQSEWCFLYLAPSCYAKSLVTTYCHTKIWHITPM